MVMMDYYLDICIKYISMPSSWKTTQLSFFWRSCITPISHSFRFYQNQSYSFNITPNQFYMLHTFYYYYLYSNFFLNIEVKQCLNERYDRIFFSRENMTARSSFQIALCVLSIIWTCIIVQKLKYIVYA